MGLNPGAACAANPVGCAIVVRICIKAAAEIVKAVAAGYSVETIDCEKGKTCLEGCPPCSPYEVGRIGYVGPRVVQDGIDGARGNGGVGVPHYKLYTVIQDKRDCKCQWMHTKKIKSLYGHHAYEIPPGAINLNGKGEPPSYP